MHLSTILLVDWHSSRLYLNSKLRPLRWLIMWTCLIVVSGVQENWSQSKTNNYFVSWPLACLRSSPSQTLSFSVTQFILAFTQECKSYVERCHWHTKTVTWVHKIDQDICPSILPYELWLQIVKEWKIWWCHDVTLGFKSVSYIPVPLKLHYLSNCWCLIMGTTLWKKIFIMSCEEGNMYWAIM